MGLLASESKISLMSDERVLEQRLEVLETKISYQDDLLEQLNEVVVTQANALDEISAELKRLKEFVEGVLSEQD